MQSLEKCLWQTLILLVSCCSLEDTYDHILRLILHSLMNFFSWCFFRYALSFFHAGCPMVTNDFVVSGTCTEQLYGMCESLWKPDMVGWFAFSKMVCL